MNQLFFEKKSILYIVDKFFRPLNIEEGQGGKKSDRQLSKKVRLEGNRK